MWSRGETNLIFLEASRYLIIYASFEENETTTVRKI